MQQAAKRLRVIKWMLAGQFIAMILVAAVFYLLSGQLAGTSALLGGFICWLPNTYFAFRAFRYRGARAAQKIVRSFYAGAFGKLILTMALFAIVFAKVKPLSAGALFVSFALVQTMNWIVPILSARAESKEHLQ